jgi:hypothetical protein
MLIINQSGDHQPGRICWATHTANALFFRLKILRSIIMHTDNLLDQITPELIPFILKNLPIQDLYNCNSINDTWKKEVSLELFRRPPKEQLKYQDLISHKQYYQPEGYYRTAKKMWDACERIGYKFTLAEIEDWLNKQAIYQIYKPSLKFIPPREFAGPLLCDRKNKWIINQVLYDSC